MAAIHLCYAMLFTPQKYCSNFFDIIICVFQCFTCWSFYSTLIHKTMSPPTIFLCFGVIIFCPLLPLRLVDDYLAKKITELLYTVTNSCLRISPWYETDEMCPIKHIWYGGIKFSFHMEFFSVRIDVDSSFHSHYLDEEVKME